MKPKANEYDGWRNSSVGIWFFEVFLKDYISESAKLNGRAPGSYQTAHEDFAAFMRNAGHIDGVEYVVTLDPFESERDEDTSIR